MNVQLTPTLTLTNLTRQDKLKIWLSANSISYSDLAKYLDITPGSAGRLCRSETAQPYRIEALKLYGVPEELLPIPVHLKTGPKPKRSS